MPRTGEDYGLVFRGKNMMLRGNTQSSYFYEAYAGSQSLGEQYAATALTGTLTTTLTSKTIAGSGTAFLTELHIGQYILVQYDSGHGADLLVVDSIVSDASCTVHQFPTIASSGKTGYRFPVMFEVNRKRGVLLWGNAVQFDKGNIVCVGDGAVSGANKLYLNGSVLAGDPTGPTSRTPCIYLFDGTARTYSKKTLGFETPSTTTTTLSLSATTMTRTFVDGDVSVGSDTVNLSSNHTLRTGTRVRLTTTGVLPAGLALATDYYIISVDENTIQFATSKTNAIAGTEVDITAAAGGGTHTVTYQKDFTMPSAYYAVTVVPANSKTGGWGNPLPTLYTSSASIGGSNYIQVNGLPSMQTGQDEWHFFVSPIPYVSSITTDNLYQLTSARYYAGKISSGELGSGTAVSLEWDNAFLEGTNRVLSFDNDAPPLAEYVGVLAGVPVYLSCYGEASTAKAEGVPPGVFVQPTKPNNPEGCPRASAVPLSPPELIIGFQDAVGRLFLMTGKGIQTLIFTGDPDSPFTTRPFWKSGFRNPYQLVFVNGTLYGWTSVGPTRSIADGDQGGEEHDFASDVEEIVRDWDGSRVMVAHDPQNEAICYIYSGYERNSNDYYKTVILPFYLRQQMWGLPIELSQDNQDMIVTGVATVDGHLEFLCGGRKVTLAADSKTDPTSWQVDTYRFDTLPAMTVSPDHTAESFTRTAHKLISGMRVYVNADVMPTGLTANASYYVIRTNADSFQLATSIANVLTATAVAFSSDGTNVSIGFPVDWYVAWQLSDSGNEMRAKYVKGLRYTGIITGASAQVYGAGTAETISVTAIEAGTSGELTTPAAFASTTAVGVSKWHRVMAKNLYAWTIRVSGTWDGALAKDRIDEVVAEYAVQGVRQ